MSTGVKEGFSGEPPITFAGQGLTGAWAEENTRESIFAAFKRKETFGTSGNRIQVRFFGSWNYPASILSWAGFQSQKALAYGLLNSAPPDRRPRQQAAFGLE